MKKINSIWFIAVSLLISVLLILLFNTIKLGIPYLLKKKESISVKGSFSIDFVADYIVWKGQFLNKDTNLKKAFKLMSLDKYKVIDFLNSNGIHDSLVTFKSIELKKEYKNNYKYNNDGDVVNTDKIFDSYVLTQEIIIESKNVVLVERISNEITDLIAFNINISSYAPKYYYSNLRALKIDMIGNAAKDGLIRANTAVVSSGGVLGALLSADIGVFQILGNNSNDKFSWGGTLNVLSKEKTAHVTVRQKYSIK